MRPLAPVLLALAAAAALAAPAAAQTAAAVSSSPYDKAPWWMRESIIASTGYVRAEVPSNRANFSASFQSIAKAVQEATKDSADKVRALGQALRAYGADKVRVETTFQTVPIYEQYRDKDGAILTNQRADKIERYQVNANVSVEVRDVSLIERVYATVLAAGPAAANPVYFSLKPDNETNTEMFRLAVADANRRARLAVEAAGGRLGPIKLIDPTGRACQTDVLVALAPRDYGVGGLEAQDVVVTASRAKAGYAAAEAPAPPPPPPPGAGGMTPESMQLPLQPPLRELAQTSCVVYGLSG